MISLDVQRLGCPSSGSYRIYCAELPRDRIVRKSDIVTTRYQGSFNRCSANSRWISANCAERVETS